MRLERGHPGQIFTIQREMGHRPFDRLAKPGTASCTMARRWIRIGRANSGAASI
jgi:hypothetical protein